MLCLFAIFRSHLNKIQYVCGYFLPTLDSSVGHAGIKADKLNMNLQVQSAALTAGCSPAARCHTEAGEYFICVAQHQSGG